MTPELIPISQILPANLRRHDAVEWESAYHHLWKRCWKVAVNLWPAVSPHTIEDVVARTVGVEVVPEILEPKSARFQEARSFEDILNLAAARVRLRVIDAWKSLEHRTTKVDLEHAPEVAVPLSEDSGRDRLDLVRHCLSQLGERCREVMVAYAVDGHKVDEIATQWREPRGTICNLIFRCRKKLTELLASHGWEN